MPDIQPEEAGRKHWLKELAAAGRMFGVVMGTAGFGLLGGLSYGAWVASQTPRESGADGLTVLIAWLIAPALYGAIGFVGGLAVGLLGLVLTWVVRLAKQIARSREERRVNGA
jgi:hypothetical protein